MDYRLHLESVIPPKPMLFMFVKKEVKVVAKINELRFSGTIVPELGVFVPDC